MYFLCSIDLSLPEDSCVFQWDRNAVAVRHDSRRIVGGRASCRHSRAVNVAARCAGQLANAIHLMPHGRTAREAVGIKFDPDGIGVEIMKNDLHLKYVLAAMSRNLHFAEVQRGPFLFETLLPIDHLPPHCAFVRRLP